MRLDRAREAAVEAGYIHDPGFHSDSAQASSTVRTLLEAIDQEARGDRVYRHGRQPEMSRAERERIEDDNRRHAESELDAALREIGEDPAKVSAKTYARVIEMMTREGVRDPLIAYERAIMEEHYAGAESGEAKPQETGIPGWDRDDENGGGTSGNGGAAPPAAGFGEGPGAGGGLRGAGQNDRQAQRAIAAGRPDWQSLRQRASEDPEITEAANEAAKTEPPASAEAPARAISAAEAAANEADRFLADILPTLTEEERGRIETALADLKNNKDARDGILRDAAVCLATAAA
jgi:uncharacterized membrane protein YgcG